DLPDVSLFASSGFQGSATAICAGDAGQGCGTGNVLGIGGTSVSSPAFAGMMALVNQKTGSRQGNANYVLYKLATQAGATCASGSSTTPAASGCVFNDVTVGTISMPCAKGSPNCTTAVSTDTYGVLTVPGSSTVLGYNATAGYDLASGLGTVNASTLVNKWTMGT